MIHVFNESYYSNLVKINVGINYTLVHGCASVAIEIL